MEITVRHAQPGDAPAIAAINLASWEAAYRGLVADAFLDRVTLADRTARWTERLTGGPDPILVTVAGDALVGYCSLALPARDADADARTGEVAAIYVSPDAFRGGIGSAMFDAALELMGEWGAREATLWVLTENARARGFYERQGFRADGALKWDDVLGAEEMRMRHRL